MRLTIDTAAKTIQVDEDVNMGELVAEMKQLFPNWKEFKLEARAQTNHVPYYPTTYPLIPFVYDNEWWKNQPYYQISCDANGTVENAALYNGGVTLTIT
jgi:hypothetical protein